MRVEQGVPMSPSTCDNTPPETGVNMKTSGAGGGARKHGAGLMGGEACAGEDEDEDD